MKVLVTGAYGQCGTAIIDHLDGDERYDFTYLNRSDRPDNHPYGGYDTVVADVGDFDAMVEAAAGHDAMVHLAAYTNVDSDWGDVHEPNVIGQYNALEAARQAELDTFVFASTNHVVGMYEERLSPDLYDDTHPLVVDETAPVRPDSFYGASKAWGEALGRLYVEQHAYPTRFYSLRICNVSNAEQDSPALYARELLSDDMEPDDPDFVRRVRRRMAMWHSRRDFAHQIDCCLRDEQVDFDVFYGVSDNANRWFDLEHARAVLGYRPRDRAEDEDIPWDGLK